MMKDDIKPVHYLAYLGVYATIIVVILSLALEIPEIGEISTAAQIGCYIGFALSLFYDYSIAPDFFLKYGATMYNISLLTSQVYALVWAMIVYGEEFSFLYILGYILVIVGNVLFNVKDLKTIMSCFTGGDDATEEDSDASSRKDDLLADPKIQ
jgi:solute carrier family 35 protein F1/2